MHIYKIKQSKRNSGSASQETVYRDKRGRKLDMLNEFMRQEALREGKVKCVVCISIYVHVFTAFLLLISSLE